MQRQGVAHVAQINELVNLSVGIAGDVHQSRLARRAFVQPADGHDWEKLSQRPVIQQRLEDGKVAEILVGERVFKFADFLRDEMADERIEDHSVLHSVEWVALLHQCVHKELAVRLGEELVDLRLAGCVLRRDLVVSHRNPLADGEIGEAGAHGWIADDYAVEYCGEALREDHAFAAARRAAHKI